MLLDCRFDNRQPQPGTARLAIARLIGTVERTENLLAILRTYARAVIIDVNRDAIFIHREAYRNFGMRVAQRVTNDILQRAFQRIGCFKASAIPSTSFGWT